MVLAATFAHFGLVLAINLVEQCPKDQHGSQTGHRFDDVSKDNCRQANTKHLPRRHDDGEHNGSKLKLTGTR